MEQLTIFRLARQVERRSKIKAFLAYDNLSSTLFLTACFLIFVYLISASVLNYTIYLKSSTKKQILSISSQIRVLNLDLAQKRTLERLEAKAKELDLVRIDMKSVKYVDSSVRPFALKFQPQSFISP